MSVSAHSPDPAIAGKKLLVVGDAVTRPAGMAALEAAGFCVIASSSALHAIKTLLREHCHAVLVSGTLPGPDVQDLCAWIRAASDELVIVLSPWSSSSDRIAVLRAGADDYIGFPIDDDELLSRLRAHFRRTRADQRGHRLEGRNGLRLDAWSHEVAIAGRPLDLTRTEFRVLRFFLTRQGHVLSRRDMALNVWDDPLVGSENVVHQHLSHLRAKLKRVGGSDPIVTVAGVGYRLDPEARAPHD